ncbi:hypothetical protein [Streptomyces sp. SAI-090]|uniref:hypothetical protein n=1 Tax=Streptomyces sp. SAI-090 TaxID=2940545 RepID=UPI0024769C61|nr:hypothetical protein [Streptomyces sp. SAI-090]MDH6522568.1 hypothetical protein [Streptomyces sp. SAI-090]
MVQHNPDCKPPVCSWRPWPQISSAGALAHARRLAQLVPRTVAARVLPAVPVLKAYTVLIPPEFTRRRSVERASGMPVLRCTPQRRRGWGQNSE